MKNDLQRTKLSSVIVNLYIASWNGKDLEPGTNRATGASAELSEAVDDMLGKDSSKKFKDSFINYKDGIILCTNTPTILDKFFKSQTAISDTATAAEKAAATAKDAAAAAPSLNATKSYVRFTIVKMPEEFKNREASLSSDYKVGEKLAVRVSVELESVNSNGTTSTATSSSSTATSSSSGLKKQVTTYRDSNAKGRSVLKSGNQASSAAVWS